MAVVRGGREEDLVLELRGDLLDPAGELRGDGVRPGGGGRGVVGLVEDQERAGPDEVAAEPGAEVGGVLLVPDQVVGDEEAVVRRPGVDAEAPLLADAVDVGAVEDLEDQAESALHLLPPLQEHRGRAADDDVGDLAPQEQLAGDQPGLDRLAEADAVGDEEVDPRHAQGHPERFELVVLDADAGPERGLEEVRPRGRDPVPAQGVVVRREAVGRVEIAPGDQAPVLGRADLGVALGLPDDLQGLSQIIRVDAREPGDRGAHLLASFDLVDEVMPLADAGDPADVRLLDGPTVHEEAHRSLPVCDSRKGSKVESSPGSVRECSQTDSP